MKSGENGLIGPGDNDYGRNEPPKPKPKYVPKRGHQVWFHPKWYEGTSKQDVYPAIVIDGDDTWPTLGVFTEDGYEVHRTVAPQEHSLITEHPHWSK